MPLHCTPDLSIIVPLLNEEAELPALFESLASQRSISFELLLCDGGSSDRTRQTVTELANTLPFPLHLLDTPRGRGHQMNAGAAASGADMLLFLHADSRFPAADALAQAFHAMTAPPPCSPHPLAGHFRLSFRRQTVKPSPAYYFYEAKARLNRGDCIRGDQGFMIKRSCFQRAGGFDDTLPFLEDLHLATSIAREGTWLLLPAEISTSARRFETEGLLRRQIINAIIVNAVVAGWSEFFKELPGLYRCHQESGKLLLFPMLDRIRTLLKGFPVQRRKSFWQATGRHVAANIWQIFFWLDTRRAFYRRLPPDEVEPRWTNRFNRYLSPWLCSSPAASVVATAVKLWHRGMLFLCRRLEGQITKTS